MPASAARGEVWIVDLGMIAKVRPCLILSISPTDQDRDLVTVVIHTTNIQGTQFEVDVRARFLRGGGVFDAQNIVTVPRVKLVRRLGALTPSQMSVVESAVKTWLGL